LGEGLKMAKKHQRPDELARSIGDTLTEADRIMLAAAIEFSSASFLECSRRLCDVLLNYCSYRNARTEVDVDPFDDPFVGAALITTTGQVLGAHRKEGRNEPHAEVETLLGALEQISSGDAPTLGVSIREGLKQKVWLDSVAAEKEFIALFEEAGRLVRENCHSLSGPTKLLLLSTLEPCRDFESQPSCSRLISAFAPDAVIYGCDDTNAKGQGRPILLQHGMNVIPNASYQLNVEVNLLFYAAVHYLNRLHTAALESQSRFEISYVIASLDRLKPELMIGDDTRLQLRFDYPVKLPVHRAPIERRAPPVDDPFPHAPNSNRLLLINHVDPDFLSLYLQRHFATASCIPGIIICSQAVRDSDSEEQQRKIAAFLEKLRAVGVRIYTNVLRKTDEKFLALQSILRLDQHVSAEGKLYVFIKEDSDVYSAKSGTSQQITEHLRSLPAPRRVTVYYGRDAVMSLKAMVWQLKAGGAFQSGNPLSRASFQTFVVARSEQDACVATADLEKWLHQHSLAQRFSVGLQTQGAAQPHSTEILHELISGRIDPIAQDGWWLEGLLKGNTWKERQAAGLFLSGAAKQDPLLYKELIASKIPASFEPDYWQESTSVLNAVAKFGHPSDPDDFAAVEQSLLRLSEGLEDAMAVHNPPECLDVVWRYIAAALSIAQNAKEVEHLFEGPKLRAYIGRSPFLLKEFFFYANRVQVFGDEALGLGFEILRTHCGYLSLAGRAQVALRVTRLSTLWEQRVGEDARNKLAQILSAFPELGALCATELERCRFVLEHRLSGVFTSIDDSGPLFCSYLFLRTAALSTSMQGLFAAVGREIDQAVSKPQQGKVPVSWRGDRTSLARLALSEVPTRRMLSYLGAMARDEDDSIKWAALVLAMDFDFRRKLLGLASKRDCLNSRSELAAILTQVLSDDAHYWLKREFVNLMELDHRPIVEKDAEGQLPLLARVQVNDVPNAKALLCSDASDEHQEVKDVLKELRKRLKRIALVLPPIDRSASSSQASNRSSTPALGLGSIASYLLSHGHAVELFDCHRFPELTDRLPEAVRGYDVVGFNVVTSSFRSTEAIVGELRRALGGKTPKVVLGGHAVTLHPNEFLEHRRFDWDYLILGDGEIPLLKIVQNLDDPELTHIEGVVPRPDNKASAVVSTANLNRADWDDLPWIDRTIYRSPGGEPYEPSLSRVGVSREAHIVMSRGCAWHCSFCTEAILRGKNGEVRRSPTDVIAEISYLAEEASVDHVQFIDDNLLPQIAARGEPVETSLTWADTLLCGLRELSQRYPAFGWRGIFRFEDFIKYEELFPSWIDRLRKSGCLLLAFGVEHGSEQRRKKLKGGSVSNDEIKRIIRTLREHDIATKGYFIVGGEGEDQQSTSCSIELAISAGFTLAYFALFKNFRELIRRSRSGVGSVEEREETFMRYKNLLADFDDRIASLNTPEDCLDSFGVAYDLDRIAIAKSCIELLSQSGFQFRDLFKYNDFHDTLDEVNDSVSVWKKSEDGSVARSFLQAVRRAYFEFYTRPEFVQQYNWLIGRGY
jgi:radical SAM superfamily enzyme YgiQ (UPF0313 family)/pyrimidine deaminase RibD-like protein